MNRRSATILVVVGAVAAVLLGASLRPTVAGAAQQVMTVVTNGPENPVPVAPQGTTPVAGTVGIDQAHNGVSVEHVTPTERFSKQVSFDLQRGDSGDFQTFMTVPEDKLAVIEFASAHFRTATNAVPELKLNTTPAPGEVTFHSLGLQDLGESSNPFFSQRDFEAAHVVRIYAAPGTRITASVNFNAYNGPDQGSASGLASITGYYVPAGG